MTHPIQHYVNSVQAHQDGKRTQASQELAKALRGEVTTPLLTSIDALLANNTPASEMVLDLVTVEAHKWRNGK